MKRPVWPRYCYLFLCLAAGLSCCLSGCIVKKRPISSPPVTLPPVEQNPCSNQLQDELRKIKQLKKDNRALADEHRKQKDLIAELQTSLLKQHQEADNYLQLTERLVGELARNNTEPVETAKQIGTAKLVVQVIEAVIATMKMNTLDDTQTDLLYWAEQYLSESKIEIERENVEGAAYLCRQAMEQVQQFSSYTNTQREQKNTKGITFQSPMPMKLLKNSNLRTAPSIEAKVLKTLDAGSPVSALGYQGNWVHVSLIDQGEATGWIYYSLLQ